MKRILIFGGSGAMGSHLAPLLCNDNKVFVTTRAERTSDQINYIQGDAHNAEFLHKILSEQWDCIIDFMHYSTEEFRLRADVLLAAAEHYVFISSARVYADSNEPITENSPRLLDVCTDSEYLSSDEYALAKARCEDILRSKPVNNWTIVRPSITYSENRLQLGASEKEDWLYKAIHGRPIIFSHDLMQKITTMTYAGDVAKGIATLICNQNAFGEAFHIVGNDHMQWSEVLDIYRDVLENDGKWQGVYLSDTSWNIRYKSKWQVLHGRYFNRVFDNSKIAKFVDVSTFKKMNEGLEMCLKAFLKNPVFMYDEDIENLHRLYETELRVGFCEIHGANVDKRFDILEKQVEYLKLQIENLRKQNTRRNLWKKLILK